MATGGDISAARSRAFFVAGVILMVFAVGSFGAKALVHPELLERYTPPVLIHGIFMVGWLALFVTQADLASRGRVPTHRRMGKISPMIAAGAAISGLVVTFSFAREFGRLETFVFDFVAIIIFVICYGVGVVKAIRRQIDGHKRFMLMATLVIISPACVRFTDVLGLSRSIAGVLALSILVGFPIALDILTVRTVKRVTVLTIAIGLSAIPLCIAILAIGPLRATVESLVLS